MNYRQCTLSVMDNIMDPDITFDDKGICNYYYEYLEASKKVLLSKKEKKIELEKTIATIKEYGKGKKYDCALGISGGVDSTFVAYKAKELGLRVLAIHFDNGWNSELSVKNIEHIISKLGFDLFTYVVDWDEFRDIQLAYLKASVIDIEAITDHGVIGAVYKTVNDQGIKYLLSGSNFVTESVMPPSWIFNKADTVNFIDIHKKFGKLPLKTFPLRDTRKSQYYKAKGITAIRFLDYYDYNKAKAKEVIKKELSWTDYGGKHYESIFTRFYQGYILPEKFKIDKRKAHLSNLIFSGQITKEEALEELKTPIYPEELFKIDKEFVLKKLGLSDEEFEEIMNMPRRKHTEFKTERSFFEKYPIFKSLEPLWVKIRPY